MAGLARDRRRARREARRFAADARRLARRLAAESRERVEAACLELEAAARAGDEERLSGATRALDAAGSPARRLANAGSKR